MLPDSQWSRRTLLAGLGLGIALFSPALSYAQVSGDEGGGYEPIIRIEEDWELVLNEPNDLIEAPQFHTMMSPFGHLDSWYALVIWNYREVPWFVPGGLQIQSWHSDYRLSRRTVDYAALSTTAETIVWTQALETNGVELAFEIIEGQSITWGQFGRDLRISATAYLSDLNGYSTDASVENSCITFGANRVDSMVIKQVRYYGATGLVAVDNTPRAVYQHEDGDEPDADGVAPLEEY